MGRTCAMATPAAAVAVAAATTAAAGRVMLLAAGQGRRHTPVLSIERREEA